MPARRLAERVQMRARGDNRIAHEAVSWEARGVARQAARTSHQSSTSSASWNGRGEIDLTMPHCTAADRSDHRTWPHIRLQPDAEVRREAAATITPTGPGRIPGPVVSGYELGLPPGLDDG